MYKLKKKIARAGPGWRANLGSFDFPLFSLGFDAEPQRLPNYIIYHFES
jgi:hypothetical protein